MNADGGFCGAQQSGAKSRKSASRNGSRWLHPIQAIRRITVSTPRCAAGRKLDSIRTSEGIRAGSEGKDETDAFVGVTRRAAMKTALAAPVAARTPRSGGKSIETENRKPGASDWQLTNVQLVKAGGFRSRVIEGYCSHQSIEAGENPSDHGEYRSAGSVPRREFPHGILRWRRGASDDRPRSLRR